MNDFETSLGQLDISLFAAIPSQSTESDKRSLLACQLAVRSSLPEYRYLEIGSYLGGSLQPHLADPKCSRIYSIDKRPPAQPDARGFDWEYRNNSTDRMLAELRKTSGDLSKIVTIDGDTRSIDPTEVAERVDLCFIDGEHTDEAAIADFAFCRSVLKPDSVILFHDAHIVYNGIARVCDELANSGEAFHAYVLPNAVFVIEMGDSAIHRDPRIKDLLLKNSESYLFALKENDRFRRFANRFPFGTARRLYARIRGANYSD